MALQAGISNSGTNPTGYNYGMLRDALMMRLGQAEGSEILSGEEIDECLEAARREINMMAPLWYFGSFNVQNGVQRYPIDSIFPVNHLWDAKIYWYGGSGGACNTLGIFQQFGDIYAFIFGNLVNFTGTYVDQTNFYNVFKKYSVIRRYFGGRGWVERDGNLWLEPAPTANGVCYFHVKVPRFPNVLAIDEVYAEAMFDYAESKGCRLLAAKQSELLKAEWSPGKSVWTKGGEVYYTMARDAEKRFYAFMSQPGTANHIYNF